MPVGLFLTTHYFTKTASTWKGQMDYSKQVSRKAYLYLWIRRANCLKSTSTVQMSENLPTLVSPKWPVILQDLLSQKHWSSFLQGKSLSIKKQFEVERFSEKMVCQQHSKSCFTQLLWINIYNFPWNEKHVHLNLEFK